MFVVLLSVLKSCYFNYSSSSYKQVYCKRTTLQYSLIRRMADYCESSPFTDDGKYLCTYGNELRKMNANYFIANVSK